MLSDTVMSAEIIKELKAAGFDPENPKSQAERYWSAVTKGIVKHLTTSAETTIPSGSSAGTYKLK